MAGGVMTYALKEYPTTLLGGPCTMVSVERCGADYRPFKDAWDEVCFMPNPRGLAREHGIAEDGFDVVLLDEEVPTLVAILERRGFRRMAAVGGTT